MKCESCGKSVLGSGRPTPLGERVCNTCSDRINGFVVGGMTGGVGGAVAGPGLMKWVRESLSGKRDPK